MVSKRHARANNPRIEGYDPEKPNSHYLDANNLYGWAMSQSLPTGAFRWEEDCESLAGSIVSHPADSPEGLILEVDLKYFRELHKAHNAYPLAPERMVVQKEWMSDYQHDLLGVGVAPTEVEKLVPNLRNKDRYVLYYCILQLYLSLGMRLAKIHRALRFRQSPWMEPYIRMNTELRKRATSDFEKDLYKLMNNSVFGKIMGNLRGGLISNWCARMRRTNSRASSPAQSLPERTSSTMIWQRSRSTKPSGPQPTCVCGDEHP